ncbi:hypothetical protein OpiT1DRAFT_01162 [Opitutaceae bacterium TAV1]|nr:hypothetical protein OpiT1DRAFT_01162 [Opitutaceae bacterium TAV1]
MIRINPLKLHRRDFLASARGAAASAPAPDLVGQLAKTREVDKTERVLASCRGREPAGSLPLLPC